MRSLKRGVFVVMVALLICFGNITYVEAKQTTSKDPMTILNEAQKAMQEKYRIDMEIYIDDGNESAMLMAMKADARNKNTYVNFIGIEMWTDAKTSLAYVKTTDNKYSVMPIEASESKVTVDETEDIDVTYKYAYSGTTIYKEFTCDVITGTKDERKIVYYIDQITHLIMYEEEIINGVSTKVYISYPEEYLEVPETIKNTATVLSGLLVKKDGIDYRTAKVNGKVVCYVVEIKKSKTSAKIEDTVTVCGKTVPVYGIRDSAFKGRGNLKSITIGENVQIIGKQAFYNCKKLSKVTIKSTKLKKIGKQAFYKNAKTLQVKVPKKKASKYKQMITKSKVSSKLKIKKY